MLLLTIPMYLLYELGLTLLWLLPAKRVAGYKAQPNNTNDGPADGP
jgi:Sec-independent protein secretion pathway component TatC